jgi:hypothetical protein
VVFAPDRQTELDIDRILTRATEEALRRQRDGFSDAVERAPRGGLMVYYGEETASATIRDTASRMTREALEYLRHGYGEVPTELLEWLSAKLKQRVSSMANQLVASSVEHRQKVRASTQGAGAKAQQAEAAAHRDIDIALAPHSLRARLRALTPPARRVSEGGADVFVCHASEDKEEVAQPIHDRLVARGYSVWLDKCRLTLGDRLLDKIDDGITSCRFGVVILSPLFFAKEWPKRELSGLAAREDAEDRKVILPIRFNLSVQELAKHSAYLASVVHADWSQGAEVVVGQIVEAMGPPSEGLAATISTGG